MYKKRRSVSATLIHVQHEYSFGFGEETFPTDRGYLHILLRFKCSARAPAPVPYIHTVADSRKPPRWTDGRARETYYDDSDNRQCLKCKFLRGFIIASPLSAVRVPRSRLRFPTSNRAHDGHYITQTTAYRRFGRLVDAPFPPSVFYIYIVVISIFGRLENCRKRNNAKMA